MGKKSASKKRVASEEVEPQGRKTKAKTSKGFPTGAGVNPIFSALLVSNAARDSFSKLFHDKQVLEGKIVRFDEIEKMYAEHHVDTANYLAIHGWIDFVKVKRPYHINLLRILMANLDPQTMLSSIGSKKIDLSIESWCDTFELPTVSEEEENFIMNLSKEDLFFRLTGKRNLGHLPFIKINQLHQEPSVRLTIQIVMNVLVPKKGSKEQIKAEEGRLLYSLCYGSEINLAKMIVDRIRSSVGRKTSPICYPMHLMTLMERAGVNLACTEDVPREVKSEINHHTLKRMGYRFRHGGWDYVGKGRVNVSFEEGEGERERNEEEEERTERDEGHTHEDTHGESTAPSQPRPTTTNLQILTQLAHFRVSVSEQLQLMQATLLSKLESIEERLQVLEEQNRSRAQPTEVSPPPSTQDPKGKAPMYPESPTPTEPINPPLHEPTQTTNQTSQPIEPQPMSESPAKPTSKHSSSSSSSSSTTSNQFEVVPRPSQPQSTSPDSEATQPASSPKPTPKAASAPSSPPKPKDTRTSYQRRKKSGGSA